MSTLKAIFEMPGRILSGLYGRIRKPRMAREPEALALAAGWVRFLSLVAGENPSEDVQKTLGKLLQVSMDHAALAGLAGPDRIDPELLKEIENLRLRIATIANNTACEMKREASEESKRREA